MSEGGAALEGNSEELMDEQNLESTPLRLSFRRSPV